MKMNDKVKNTYKSSFITKSDYLLQKKKETLRIIEEFPIIV